MKNTTIVRIAFAGLVVAAAWFAVRNLFRAGDHGGGVAVHLVDEGQRLTKNGASTRSPAAAAVEAASTGVPAAAGQPGRARIPTYAEKAAAAQDPEMREYITRRVEKEYAALFAKLKLAPEREEALSMLLVDKLYAPTIEETGEYERLAAELLSPEEYAEFATFQRELPIKLDVRAAMKAVMSEAPPAAAEAQRLAASVDAVVRGAPRNDAPIWMEAGKRVEEGRHFSEAELASLAATATQQFEAVLAAQAGKLTEAQMGRLRAWYQETYVQFHLRAYRNARPGG